MGARCRSTFDRAPLAVPTAAGWRLAAVPLTVGRVGVARLLASCDRRTTFGRRDHVVLMLARLGLHAGEVAALELADLDWRTGEFVVWPSLVTHPHRSTPVRRGVKYGLTLWWKLPD